MTLFAFLLIVFSACLHASWNLLAKRSAMTVAFYTVICATAAVLWCHVQFWTPLQVWHMPWIFYLYIAGSVTSDLIYCLGLVRAYRTMEMSTAYPMMRSLPLLFTAAVTSIAGWGETLTPLALSGMLVVFIGCMIMPMKDFKSFKWQDYINSRMFFIIIVACGTTGYTIFDSQAQGVLRQIYTTAAKPLISLSYYSTRGICLTSTLLLACCILRGEKLNLKNIFAQKQWMAFAAGAFASLTYVTVLLSMNYVTNVSYVQVFRQLGLIFGLLGGIVILKERCSAPKITGTLLIITGLILTVL